MKIVALSLIVLALIKVLEILDIKNQLNKGRIHPKHKSFWMKEEQR